ncbi:MAG: sulfatase-like hydrolase/transferase [Myxococcota bacterium]
MILLAGCTAAPVPAEPLPTWEFPAVDFVGDRPKNLLMISIDTLRRDHLDRYATDGIERMPFLSSLFAEGVALDDHQQCGNWTFQSTSCTLIGRPNEDLGWFAKLNGDGPTPVPDGQETIAARLGEVGFRTMLVSANPWLSSQWNNAQGYQERPRVSGLDAASLAHGALISLGKNIALEPTDHWMLHVHFTEPHTTYSPPEAYRDEVNALPPIPYDLDDHDTHYDVVDDEWPAMTPELQALVTRHLRARYDAEVRYLDDQLAVVWDELDRDGWLDDTLVVIWTDHGEQFWEHGHQTHAWGLAAEETDGLLLLWARDIVPRAWGAPTASVDLLPTLLDVFGLPPDETLPGFALGQAPDHRARFTAASAREGTLAAVTRDGMKLTWWFDGRASLVDRNVDRQEQVELYDPARPEVAELWALLAPQVDALSAAVPEVELVLPSW